MIFHLVFYVLTNTNPWILLLIVIALYYVLQRIRVPVQATSSASYENLSMTWHLLLKVNLPLNDFLS